MWLNIGLLLGVAIPVSNQGDILISACSLAFGRWRVARWLKLMGFLLNLWPGQERHVLGNFSGAKSFRPDEVNAFSLRFYGIVFLGFFRRIQVD